MSARRSPPSVDDDVPSASEARDKVVALPRRTGSASLAASGLADTGQDAGQDAGLVAGVGRGERAAFAELMRRHLSAVLATARRITRDEAEAEDIAQEAFLRLWDQADGLEVGAYGVRPWLRRVASNLAIDGLRKGRRLDVTDDVPEQAEAASQLHGLEAQEVSGRIAQALASLPERQRLAVSLFHFDDLSQREVAALLEVTEDALESLLARGRRRLRQLLEDDWQQLLPDNRT